MFNEFMYNQNVKMLNETNKIFNIHFDILAKKMLISFVN